MNNFFGSKLNTVLLLVLIILMVFAIKLMLKNKEMYLHPFSQNQEQTTKLAFCPDEKIIDKMPGSENDALKKEYFTYKGKRYEISEFDTVWVKNNCSVKEQLVY